MRGNSRKQNIFISSVLSLTLILSSILSANVSAEEAGLQNNVWAEVEQNEQGYYDFSPSKIEIEMGAHSGYFITQDGGLFGWGRDDLTAKMRQQIYPFDDNSKGTITPIYGGIKQMDNDIYVNNKCEVYVFAHQDRVAGDYDEDAFHPFWPAVKVPNLPSNMIQVARTAHAMLALSADGIVYGWGKNDTGALLKGEDYAIREDVNPVQLDFPEKITDIIVENGNKRFAIGESGSVYIWGSTAVLDGADLPGVIHTTPHKISFKSDDDLTIIDVSATFRHALFLTKEGKAYTSGSDMAPNWV